MKRLYLSIFLLLLICGLGLWNISSLRQVTEDLTSLLEQAETAAVEENWEAASRLTREAHDLWKERETYVYITVSHTLLEEISASFQSVETFIYWQEIPEYTSANNTLLAQIKLIWESEEFSLENLL